MIIKYSSLLLFFSISWGQLYDPETGMLASENPCEYERYLELLKQFWGDEFELWSKSEIEEWKILSRKCEEHNRGKNIIDSALVKKMIKNQNQSYEINSKFLKPFDKHYINFFGIPNHRTGISMFGYSSTLKIKNGNEYYSSIGTLFFIQSVSVGWKHYEKNPKYDDFYLALSLVGSFRTQNREDETLPLMDFVAGNLSVGYEKKFFEKIFLNIEIFTLTGIMPDENGKTDGIRILVKPSFHFNYRY